jgi:hypothetical protein
MRKELVWAGIVGVLFGLVIGFGVWRIHFWTATNNEIVPTPTPQADISQFKITIDKPENFDVITESPMSISGITKSLTWVVVSTDNSDYLTQSLVDGTFSVDIALSPGINHIKATSVNSQGGSSSQKTLVVYSSSFQVTPETSGNATGEADIANVVAQKIAEAQKKPKAYIGTVTDLVDSTIQIKTTDAQIQQIETDKAPVTVVNIKGTSNKTVKLTDIAIGDFIIAMGYIDGNDVLDAQRILIADAAAEPEIGVLIGKVDSVATKSLTFTPTTNGSSQTVTPDKNTNIKSYSDGKTISIKLSAISPSDIIILVSDTTGTPYLTRSIFDIGGE